MSIFYEPDVSNWVLFRSPIWSHWLQVAIESWNKVSVIKEPNFYLYLILININLKTLNLLSEKLFNISGINWVCECNFSVVSLVPSYFVHHVFLMKIWHLN